MLIVSLDIALAISLYFVGVAIALVYYVIDVKKSRARPEDEKIFCRG